MILMASHNIFYFNVVFMKIVFLYNFISGKKKTSHF